MNMRISLSYRSRGFVSCMRIISDLLDDNSPPSRTKRGGMAPIFPFICILLRGSLILRRRGHMPHAREVEPKYWNEKAKRGLIKIKPMTG
jgi:hypothetical protein